jgi:hypothetical protein
MVLPPPARSVEPPSPINAARTIIRFIINLKSKTDPNEREMDSRTQVCSIAELLLVAKG